MDAPSASLRASPFHRRNATFQTIGLHAHVESETPGRFVGTKKREGGTVRFRVMLDWVQRNFP